jgi:SRSO17 transposase
LVVKTRQVRFTPDRVSPTALWVTRFAAFYQLAIVTELKRRRLSRTLEALKGNSITVVIDETGDRKKGKRTDYVARLYLGSIGKIDSGIVSVNAYGIYQNIIFPLIFKVFKPKAKLKEGDSYQTKIELASEIIKQLIDFGFHIELVLADSLYGENGSMKWDKECFE